MTETKCAFLFTLGPPLIETFINEKRSSFQSRITNAFVIVLIVLLITSEFFTDYGKTASVVIVSTV